MTTTLLAESTMACGVRSDAGRVRHNNEDSFLVAPELNLFVLSDGMGGMASGEIASRLTAEAIVSHCREAERNPALPNIGPRVEGVSEISSRLVSAACLANSEVRRAAQADAAHGGMGATVVAVRVQDERLSVVHVGDSRAYRLRGEYLEQLTQDHSFVAEQLRHGQVTAESARASKLQNVLVRAIGAEPNVDADVSEQLLIEGDTVLLCSDGLTRELSDAQIAAVLCDAPDVQQAADALVELANRAGGEDNITVLVLQPSPRSSRTFGRLGKWFGKRGNEFSKGANVKWQNWS